MQELTKILILLIITISLSCNLVYILRDMHRERRREERERIRRYRERTGKDRV